MTPFFLSLACRLLGHRPRVIDWSLALDTAGNPRVALGKCTRCGEVMELTHAEAREVMDNGQR